MRSQHQETFFSLLNGWNNITASSESDLISLPGTSSAISSIKLINYKHQITPENNLTGRKIFFFSDMHYNDSAIHPELFRTAVRKAQPDWIVFGGDLITYSCHFDDAFKWLHDVFAEFADIPKFTVYGNWDRRKRPWISHYDWRSRYAESGFQLLVNNDAESAGVRFYGLDETRGGHPVITEESTQHKTNCYIAHNIESVIESGLLRNIPEKSIILCGHTHGGQVRLPLFGALFTSTRYWKLFEYGQYKHRKSGTSLIVTSGLGYSRLPVRMLCPPEAVVINFTV